MVTRRQAVAAAAAAALMPWSQSWAALTATPRQSAGPFYPESEPLEADADLATVAGASGPPKGTITHVVGRVVDTGGRPVSGARVEIWQCDAFGRYHHRLDGGGADPNFQGFGFTETTADGGYRFRTIRPVPYPGRTPHIHFAVIAPGAPRLTTQMYVEGEPLNDRDFILSRISDPKERASVIVPLVPAPEMEPASLIARFDIVLTAT
jgi:protocatechuate 3,4-dioxygenase beta subunit